MRLKKFLSVIGLLAMLAAFCGFTGCGGKLEQGGAYAPGTTTYATNADTGAVATNFVASAAPDYPFAQVEIAFDFAYSTADAVFTAEQNNRALFWSISPDIKHTLDKLRPTAVTVRDDYIKARIAYQANPVPANLSGLQSVLTRAQALSASVSAALPATVATK